MSNTDKSKVRSEIRARLELLDEDFINETAADLPDMLFDVEEFAGEISRAKRIALYRPIKGEMPIDALALRLLSMGKTICYPKIEDGVMNFYDVDSLDASCFTEGKYGILEPSDTSVCVNGLIDVALVPGLAYNEEGTRLGRGGGYYDKFMAEGKIYTVAVCYDFQIDSDIPVEEHDITVDLLLPVMTGEE